MQTQNSLNTFLMTLIFSNNVFESFLIDPTFMEWKHLFFNKTRILCFYNGLLWQRKPFLIICSFYLVKIYSFPRYSRVLSSRKMMKTFRYPKHKKMFKSIYDKENYDTQKCSFNHSSLTLVVHLCAFITKDRAHWTIIQHLKKNNDNNFIWKWMKLLLNETNQKTRTMNSF